MNRHGIPWVAILLSAAVGAWSEPSETEKVLAAQQALQKQLGEGWRVTPEKVEGLSELRPEVLSFLCEEEAMGAFDYAKVLTTPEGAPVARLDTRDLMEQAKATELRVSRDGERWVVTPPLPRGLDRDLIRRLEEGKADAPSAAAERGLVAFVRRFAERTAPPVANPEAARALSVALITTITVEGKLEEAQTDAPSGGGFEVTLKWRQGSLSYGYDEQAVWTTKFDVAGKLLEVSKKQVSHEAHGRR